MEEENKDTAVQATEEKSEVSEKVASLIETVKTLNVLELNSLVKALEEEFGVSAAAMVAAAPGAGPAAAGGEAEEKTSFDVILADAGATKIKVIKVVRELTGLGLKDAKALVDDLPKPVKEGLSKEDAEEAVAKLKEVGATAELK